MLAGLVVIGRLLRSAGFMEWQKSALGASFLSNAALFLALPAAALLLGRRNPGSYGLTAERLADHARQGGIVGVTLLPATMLFPLVASLELDPKQLPGAAILGAGFAVAGLLGLLAISQRPALANRAVGPRSTLLYLSVLAAGLLAAVLAKASAPIVTRAVYVLLFVALLEELFFRGYVQGRLNDAFERPYSLFNTSFGPGLILSGVLFGLFHPIMSPTGGDWAWALWTGLVGCVFGFLREKTGAALASAVAHGIILLPQVALGG